MSVILLFEMVNAWVYGSWVAYIIHSNAAMWLIVGISLVLSLAWLNGLCGANGVISLHSGLFAFLYYWGLGVVGIPVALVGACVGWLVGYAKAAVQMGFQGIVVGIALTIVFDVECSRWQCGLIAFACSCIGVGLGGWQQSVTANQGQRTLNP
ncbi:MAG: hypothetical protein ACK5Q5_12790 [Planctomycetaceae bacterium]